MTETILLPSVSAEIRDFISKDDFLNPGGSREVKRVFPLDKGIMLEFTGVNSESYRDPENPDEYIPSHILEVNLYASELDNFGEPDRHAQMRECGEYGEQLETELMSIFTETLTEYNDNRSLEFVYMGQWKLGHTFRSQLYFDNMTGTEVTAVDVSLTAAATVTRNVPTSVVEESEDAVLTYLIDSWWRQTDRSTKARLFDITNTFYPVDSVGKELSSLQDHMGVDMQVTGTEPLSH
jgi:hypothetical protein